MVPAVSGLVWVLLAFAPPPTLQAGDSTSAAGPERIGIAPLELEGDVSRKLSKPAAKRLRDAVDADYLSVELAVDDDCDEACLARAARELEVAAFVQVYIAVENRDYTLRTRVVNSENGEVLREDLNSCEICTYDESLEVLDQQLANVGSALSQLLDAEPEPAPPPPDEDELVLHASSKRLRIGGWTMVGVGAAATVGGVALAALHEGEGGRQTLAPGVGLLVGGVFLVGGGVSLVVIDRRGRKRATATATPTASGLVIRGRF